MTDEEVEIVKAVFEEVVTEAVTQITTKRDALSAQVTSLRAQLDQTAARIRDTQARIDGQVSVTKAAVTAGDVAVGDVVYVLFQDTREWAPATITAVGNDAGPTCDLLVKPQGSAPVQLRGFTADWLKCAVVGSSDVLGGAR